MAEPAPGVPPSSNRQAARVAIAEPPRVRRLHLAKIESGTVRVGIIGLGYVGLPLARAFAERGIAVLGFDVDPAKVAKLERGRELHRPHPRRDDPRDARAAASRRPTDFDRLGEPDAIIICVPTPLTDAREPDLTYIVKSAQAIAARLRPGQLVVLESTTYPGTTREVVLPILEAGGPEGRARDFFLAFSPEREDPGNPQLLGADDPQGRRRPRRRAAWSWPRRSTARSSSEVVPVSSPEVAEACKILENTYRAVNIALVNELKVLYDRMGIDVWEVIEAAKTKPFGFQAFYPGPGPGRALHPDRPVLPDLGRPQARPGARGSSSWPARSTRRCPPTSSARSPTRSTTAASRSRGARSLLLGMAYKKDVDDPRESPGLRADGAAAAQGGRSSTTTTRTSPCCRRCGTIPTSGWPARS